MDGLSGYAISGVARDDYALSGSCDVSNVEVCVADFGGSHCCGEKFILWCVDVDHVGVRDGTTVVFDGMLEPAVRGAWSGYEINVVMRGMCGKSNMIRDLSTSSGLLYMLFLSRSYWMTFGRIFGSVYRRAAPPGIWLGSEGHLECR